MVNIQFFQDFSPVSRYPDTESKCTKLIINSCPGEFTNHALRAFQNGFWSLKVAAKGVDSFCVPSCPHGRMSIHVK